MRHARAQQIPGQVQLVGATRRGERRRRRLLIATLGRLHVRLQRRELRVEDTEERGEAIGPLRGGIVVRAEDTQAAALLEHRAEERG